MYNSNTADNLRRFAVFFIDMLIVNLIIGFITSPILAYLEAELGSLSEAQERFLDLVNSYMNGQAGYDEVMQMANGLLKYSGLVLAVQLPFSLLVFFLYFVLQPMKTKYQTLGRKLMNVRVMSSDNNPLNYKRLCLRELVGSFLFYNVLGSLLTLISGIVCLTNKRSLVDIISKTDLIDLNKLNMNYQNNNYNNYDNNSYNNYDNNSYDNNSYNNYDNSNYDGYDNYNNSDNSYDNYDNSDNSYDNYDSSDNDNRY